MKVGIFGLLGLMFIGLKLGGVIEWSWWWVTSPFWGPPLVAMLVIMLWGFYVGIVAGIKAVKERLEHE